ncbi:MAG: threonine synthase [bacterium]|nr:threonine synthase [bacterium]
MSFVSHLQCVRCGQSYGPTKVGFTCPTCGPDEGILDVVYDLPAVGRNFTLSDLMDAPPSHWRYGPLLPLEKRHAGRDWPIGWTPLTEVPSLANRVGVKRLRIKDEGRSLSGSFKDRASSVGVVRALDAGAKAIACASTGNAATSLAACAALAGLPAYIFVSQAVPAGKLAQLLIYGARVFKVQGTYAQAYDLCMQACERFGWYNRCCAYNPYLVEGKKTGGMELAEQCFADPPDWVAVSVGDGCTIAAIGKGLRQMRELEIIDWSTRLLGVQAEDVAPIAGVFEADPNGRAEPDALPPCDGDTFADSINVPVPRNWRKAVRAVRQCEGTFVTVSDDQIAEAMRITGHHAGVFAEPAGATSVAGIAQAVADGIIDRRASVVAMLTGNGLKDLDGARRCVGQPMEIAPELDEVTRRVKGLQ